MPGKDGKGGYGFWAVPAGWSATVKSESLLFVYEIKKRRLKTAVLVDMGDRGTYDCAINILL